MFFATQLCYEMSVFLGRIEISLFDLLLFAAYFSRKISSWDVMHFAVQFSCEISFEMFCKISFEMFCFLLHSFLVRFPYEISCFVVTYFSYKISCFFVSCTRFPHEISCFVSHTRISWDSLMRFHNEITLWEEFVLFATWFV